MNPTLDQLQPYPFQKLSMLLNGVKPPPNLPPIRLSIGEPMHPLPDIAAQTLARNAHLFNKYPTTRGEDTLREAIAGWLSGRFRIPETHLDPARHILPVAGTREALFSFTQATIDRNTAPLVVMPNPFYQIYEGAALLAGAGTWLMPCTPENDYLPDLAAVPEAVWQRCQILFLCTPGNPTGAVMPEAQLAEAIRLAHRYHFVIVSDECYSEIYPDEQTPPPGLLQVSEAVGNPDFARCVVFHSLSKRSNAPGLRSGFVAGDPDILQAYFRYRTYHGATLPLPVQAASAALWQDEGHVQANRAAYRRKFQVFMSTLEDVWPQRRTDAGFYLWAQTPVADEALARVLYQQANVVILPGRYLSRSCDDQDPGVNHCRMALVASEADCEEAAVRIRTVLSNYLPEAQRTC
ncbi:succinyldiaminopimelate transaminase [Hahella sp. SMD15-11]|uniref:Succinyldiaminopimelate transaminase n=1 Tax=Thermohahella caldifontis TaxID=3142973 RepID=A0AB39UZY6_9GAMM